MQSHSLLICVALPCNDSRTVLHTMCQIRRNCQCKWLWASLGSSGSPDKVCVSNGMSVSTALPTLVPPRHIDDCSRFTLFTENFVICCYQVTKIFLLWHDCTSTSSARRPRYFCLQADVTILGPSESACRHCAHPKPIPLLLATPLIIHEKNWKSLDIHDQGFRVALKDSVHRPNSPWTLAINGNSCNRSLCTSSRPLFFVFVFCRFMLQVSP